MIFSLTKEAGLWNELIWSDYEKLSQGGLFVYFNTSFDKVESQSNLDLFNSNLGKNFRRFSLHSHTLPCWPYVVNQTKFSPCRLELSNSYVHRVLLLNSPQVIL